MQAYGKLTIDLCNRTLSTQEPSTDNAGVTR